MTDTSQLYNSVAPLRNVTTLVAMIERVNNRAFGLPGLATFYGHSGFGKTTAAVYAANKFDALLIQVKESWTGKKLGETILIEMGATPKKTIADMIEQIAEQLMHSDTVLLIDDAQYLVKRGMIGHVRDIYESSGTTIILIGEERLPQDLQRWENVHGRMYEWAPALPACLADVGHLAKIYCPHAALAEDFQAKLLRESHHSIRRVCINLAKADELARTRGLETIALEDWGDQAFFACTAPKPRRELA